MYKLATCGEYRIVANAFGVAKALLTNTFINFAGMNCFAVTPLFLDNANANRLIVVQLSDMYFQSYVKYLTHDETEWFKQRAT